jgi:hypothetical protein
MRSLPSPVGDWRERVLPLRLSLQLPNIYSCKCHPIRARQLASSVQIKCPSLHYRNQIPKFVEVGVQFASRAHGTVVVHSSTGFDGSITSELFIARMLSLCFCRTAHSSSRCWGIDIGRARVNPRLLEFRAAGLAFLGSSSSRLD